MKSFVQDAIAFHLCLGVKTEITKTVTFIDGILYFKTLQRLLNVTSDFDVTLAFVFLNVSTLLGNN